MILFTKELKMAPLYKQRCQRMTSPGLWHLFQGLTVKGMLSREPNEVSEMPRTPSAPKCTKLNNQLLSLKAELDSVLDSTLLTKLSF